jgi:chromosome segregation ATPase
MDKGFSRLRVEEVAVSTTERVDHEAAAAPRTAPEPRTVADWRRLAVQAGERLAIAENQAKDLRAAADESRARLTKQKTRLDNANARINELQSQLISVTAERDTLQERVSRLDEVRRQVHAFRRECLEGSLWKIFENL